MAFQQPQQRPQPQRQVTPAKVSIEQQVPASPARKRTIDESQEWILFSPAQHEHQSRTSQTPRTATHLSDFGSLETHVRSQPLAGPQDNDLTCQGTEADDDGAELDSLDDGLHAFHHPVFSDPSNNLDHSGGSVLPTHDGFGTFPLSAGLQEQLWQFERYNPHRRRHVRRKSSVQKKLDAMTEDEEHDVEDERTARIEKWRLEQSKAVLDEIEKETRRRRRRISRGGSMDVTRTNTLEAAASRVKQMQHEIIHEEPESDAKTAAPPASESFWQRITRRVIRDLIGLDENTLSVIFGESLPEEASPTPTLPSPIAVATASPSRSRVTFDDSAYSWEIKLLDHIARELGVLVHQLTEHDGRAFSSYMRMQDEPDYAGMPIRDIPRRQASLRQQRLRSQPERTANATSSGPVFEPTVLRAPTSPSDAPDTSLWGIEEEPDDRDDGEVQTQQEREYWERDIDVNMIFSYLKRRFSMRPSASRPPAAGIAPSPGPLLPASWATANSASALGTSPQSIRRAEVIRRQHPLVSRAAERAEEERNEGTVYE